MKIRCPFFIFNVFISFYLGDRAWKQASKGSLPKDYIASLFTLKWMFRSRKLKFHLAFRLPGTLLRETQRILFQTNVGFCRYSKVNVFYALHLPVSTPISFQGKNIAATCVVLF